MGAQKTASKEIHEATLAHNPKDTVNSRSPQQCEEKTEQIQMGAGEMAQAVEHLVSVGI